MLFALMHIHSDDKKIILLARGAPDAIVLVAWLCRMSA